MYMYIYRYVWGGVGFPRDEENASRHKTATWSHLMVRRMPCFWLVTFPHFLQLQVITLGRTNWKNTARKTRIAEKQ